MTIVSVQVLGPTDEELDNTNSTSNATEEATTANETETEEALAEKAAAIEREF